MMQRIIIDGNYRKRHKKTEIKRHKIRPEIEVRARRSLQSIKLALDDVWMPAAAHESVGGSRET